MLSSCACSRSTSPKCQPWSRCTSVLRSAERLDVSSAMTAPSARKLKILCLHGYLQNSKEFAGKLGSLRKALKSRADFVFIDAPHIVPAQQDKPESTSSEQRAWWTWEDADIHGRPSLASQYVGADTSLHIAKQALQEHQPVDGILGFSQGAALSGLLLSCIQQHDTLPQVKFAILAGAFLPKDPKYSDMLFSCAVKTPTLFVSGEQDQLISPERTQQLIDMFDTNCIQKFQHGGGHMVPTCTGDFKQTLRDFLDKHGSE